MFKKMKVAHTDGTEVEVEGRKADIIRFERQFKLPAGRMFGDGGLFVEHLWFYAWCAEARAGDVGSFDDWMETVDSVEILDTGDDQENPTEPDRSPSP